MFIVLVYISGLMHRDFVPAGETIAAFYVQVLKSLRDYIRRVRSEL